MAPIRRLKPYSGPPLLSYGFRPFFLAGSLFAAAAVLAWLPAYFGEIEIPTAFAPRDWHAHEMIYGYLPAVVTGFLLTAIPNWTGRLPLQGRPLVSLLVVWLAGRAAIAASAFLPWMLTAAIDLAFLALVAAAATREVVAGRNWRNLRVVSLVVLMFMGNLAFHLEAHFMGFADYAIRLGLSAVTLLVALVGGRIIPSFTRNWLARENPGRLPAAFGKLDVVAIAVAAIALGAWTAVPESKSAAAALLLAAFAHAARLATWAGERTIRDRLVLVLHVAYAFLPIGLTLLACAALGGIPVSAGLHALAIGCIGLMTMAVMSRASLGHTGRRLSASTWVQAVYAALILAAVTRVAAALWTERSTALLCLAGAAWAAGFGLFAAAYWRIFTQPSITAR